MMPKSDLKGSSWTTSKEGESRENGTEGLEDCTGKPSKNGYRSWPVRNNKPSKSSLILNSYPPILQVSKLKTPGAVEVYALLFESAYKDRSYDKRKDLPWSERLDSGATTEWTIKGLASELGIGKTKVRQAVDVLLINGFIRVVAFVPSGNGSDKRLFQVVHYNQLKNVRHANEVMSQPFGLTTFKTPDTSVPLGEEDYSDHEDWYEFLATA